MYNLPVGIFEEFTELFGGVLLIYIGLLGLGALIGLALYILNGIGIMKMSQSLNISNGWLAFVPFASVFAFGRVGQKYIKRDGTNSAKFSFWLLALYIAMFILVILLWVFLVLLILTLIVYAEEALSSDTQMAMEMFSGVIPVIICTFIVLAVEVAYMILYYICLWRTFAIFDSANATLYLVLSIFFTFLTPIFIFILRNKQPKITYEQRLGMTPLFIEKENLNEENDAPII